MRMTAAVFHTAQQQCRAVGEQRGAGVENAIDLIGPVRGGQDGVEFVALK